MRQTIAASIKAGERMTMTAERLLDLDAPMVELPKYVRELSNAAKLRAGEPNLYADVVSRWRGQVAKLGQGADLAHGEYTIQSATRELVRRLETAKPAQVDKLVDRWVLEKARYQARVIARNEAVEAARQSSLESLRKQPWVHGVRWMLSPSGKRKPDVCDVYAGADLYGLGPGGYPADKVPTRHVGCICGIVGIVDDAHYEREVAVSRGEVEPPKPWLSGKRESAEDWLRAQSADARRAIVGPTRARLVESGREVLAPGAANFKPVHELLGKQRPRREMSLVDARAVIAADRAKMKRPFPKLKKVASK
jgi:hypothetical protein